MTLNYSIVLRTLGYGGEKYQALLDSIKSQTIQPIEFIVVIPPEYELPKERLGTETFIRGPKGMVRQRVDGINAAKGDYLLIVDDDVEFPPDFVEKLWGLMNTAKADVVCPIIDDDAVTGEPGIVSRIISFLGSGAYVSKKRSPYALRISPLGGTIRQAPLMKGMIYYTQTGSGGCCFISREAAQRLDYEQEMWLEENVRYAYPDDQVFFYKAYLMGMACVYAHECPYHHLHAASSVRTLDEEVSRHVAIKHDACRNLVIFWHRFQYSLLRKKFFMLCMSALGMLWKVLFNFSLHVAFYGWRPSHWPCISACLKGYKDGFLYLRSSDYKEKQVRFQTQLFQVSCRYK